MLRQAGLVLLLLLLVPSASAHAVLLSADPAPNTHVDVGVSVVVYRFTEDVEREYTGADVFDSEGDSMAAGAVEFDADEANVIRLPIQPLGDGIYQATWKALSVDTHTTRGTFVFAVGNATLLPGQYPEQVEEQDPDAVRRDGFARFAFFAGLFLALGIPVFAFAVMRGRDPPPSLFATAASFAAVGVAGAFVGLLFLGQRTDLGLAAISTVPGRSFAARGGFLALAALACAWAALRPAAWRRAAIAALVLALASLVATSLGSHAASVREDRWLYVAADALHLLMASVWIAGVIGFLHVAWGRPQGELARMILRFSPIAVTSVALVLLTGTLASLQHIPCWREGASACIDTLRTESYAQLVALKLALMVPLIVIGAYHRYRVAPRLEGGSPAGFRRAVQAEAAIMALVLLAAGVLASTAPPAEVDDAIERPPQQLELQNFTRTSHVIVQISPTPVKVGVQRLVVVVHPLDGPLENSTLVQVKVYPAGEDEPEVTTELTKVTPNEWERTDGFFTSEGEWKVTVLLQRPREFSKLTFNVTVVR